MKPTLSWLSGASLMCVFGYVLYTLGVSVGSRPPPASIISLPGGVLLCVAGRLGPDWSTFSCSRIEGLSRASEEPSIEPSYESIF